MKEEGRVSVDESGGLRAERMVIPVGAEKGWEVAFFDHFRAVCAAMAVKLRAGATRSAPGDVTGGATWTFELSKEHPLTSEVQGLLTRTRTEIQDLWLEVEAINGQTPLKEEEIERLTFYCGQFVETEENGE